MIRGLACVFAFGVASVSCLKFDDAPTYCALHGCSDAGPDAALDSPAAEAGPDLGTDAPDTSTGDDAGLAARIASVERTCALLSACDRGSDAPSFTTCLRDHLQQSVADLSGHPLRWPGWKCLDDASTCADIAACTGGGVNRAACSGHPVSKFCKGAVLVSCGAGAFRGATLCGSSGRTCDTLSTTDAACVGPGNCSTDTTARCEGASFVSCTGGSASPASKSNGQQCGALGGICDGTDGVGCTGEDELCGTATTATCDKNVATHCRFGRRAKTDCSALLRVCTGSATPCTPTGTECSDSELAKCGGAGELRYCLGGNMRAITCKAIGLGACELAATADGVSGACTAP